MDGHAALGSALAWVALSEQERDWLSASFYIVGLGIAAVDGETTREEITLLQGSVAEIEKGTPSYVLAQATRRFLQEQRLADLFFTPMRLSPEEAQRRSSEAIEGARSAIAKLPEGERHQFGAALIATGLSVMNTKGSKKADHLASAAVLDAIADDLGIDPGADLAWVEAHRPGGPSLNAVAVLAGITWIASATLLGFYALQPLLAKTQGSGVPWNWVIALSSAYIGGRIILQKVGFKGIPNPRYATGTAAWKGLLTIISSIGVPTDILAASVLWGILLVGWQSYQIAQGLTDPVYVASTILAAVAVVLSLVARAGARSAGMPKP